MLRGIYAPTDFISKDRDPSLTPEEKLTKINASPVYFRPSIIRDVIHYDDVIVSLPFIDGASFHFGLNNYPETLFTEHVNVGDVALYGNGIGSRLLRAGVRYAVDRDKRVSEFHTGWARLGLVNTAITVFGEDNVGVEKGGERYGWGGDKPLDAVFDDFPPKDGEKYLVYAIAAQIDHDLAMSWELPLPINE